MPDTDASHPRLRPIEAFPIQHEGQNAYCIRDPQRIAMNALILPPAAFFIVSFFDGNHSIDDIRSECRKQFQQEVPEEQIRELITTLDRELYLETERYESTIAQIEKEYHEAPARKAFHAGGAYEGDPATLQSRLQSLLREIGSPRDDVPDGELTALVSPHIDMHRGGPGFAFAYRELQRHSKPDLCIVFGTGHQCRHSLLVPTVKSYDTPLGVVPTDTDFVRSFAENTTLDLFEEELLHRDEHSIEFQAVWLRHVLGQDWQGAMVPILTGSLHTFIQEGRSPRNDSTVAQALDTLRAMIEAYPGRVVVIAGADMSHVGKRFGHPEGIPDHELKRVEEEDHAILEAIRSGSAEDFFFSIEKQKDRNHVCGLAPVYMTMDVTRPKAGCILDYDRAIETDTESVVTYSSAALFR